MISHLENFNKEDGIVHFGLIALSAFFAASITGLAVYFLL
jgi:hypothetical protein